MSNVRIEAGALNCEVILEQDVAAGDSTLHGHTPEWQEIGDPATPEPRWMSIRQLSGRELERASMLVAEATHMLTMRWEAGITPVKMRGRFNGRYFHFGHVNNVDERNIKIEIIACEKIG